MLSGVKRNLQIGFGLSLLLLIISSVASFISIESLIRSAERVNHTSMVIRELESTISAIKDAETGQRGFLLTGRDEFLDPYVGAYKTVLASLNKIKTLTGDSPEQQQNHIELKKTLLTRLDHLETLINLKKENKPVRLVQLERGKKQMDEARILVSQMKSYEEDLLKMRTTSMNRFATFTPFLIVAAALLSLIITIFSYLKVNADFAEKARLQKDLEDKEQEMADRIHVIQNLAEQISSGDYFLRINDTEKDGLGALAVALDKMAASLQQSFNQLHDAEWLQTGIAELNQNLVGEKEVPTLSADIIEFVAGYTSSQVAALYLIENNSHLKLQSGYALEHHGKRDIIQLGAGLVGQAALSGKQILLSDISPDDLSINFASGEIKPVNILAVPIFYDKHIHGVMELASTTPFSKNDLNFLSGIMHNVGIAINTGQIRQKQQELLEETQAQSEELQNQHSEMENMNAELEMQTQKIQASEEELRVQQEELLQSNQELEEKTRLLEEKNQVILERNLDVQQKAEQLELSTRYKSEFLANMSHELRTPLNSILLLSRLMSENKKLDTEEIEYAQVIQNAGQGLLSLIDEILDLSKIESGKMDLDYSSMTIKEVAHDMRSLFEPVTREKNLEMNVIVHPETPELIVSDKMRLEQILKNLLSNAIKFTTNGAVDLKISKPENSPFIHFSVKDTGIGIAQDKQHLVFEAFQQADGSTRRKFGGTGLGLSISRELAKLLGGEIKLSSEPGKGSEFTLLVPASKPLGATVPIPALKPNSEISQTKPDKSFDFTVPTIPQEIPDDRHIIVATDKVILIIEDDTNFSRALMDFSRSNGYKCITAVRGDHGISMAVKYKPLAILLDIQLPVKDGWQVMQELKSNPATRHIPVHIMSSMQMKKESLLKGAVDFINKPVALEQMTQIFAKLEDALSRHPKKVLIVEENPKHAQALANFLSNFNINSEISSNVSDGVTLLQKNEIDCVILDMGLPDQNAYETLEHVKKTPGLENLPIIIFTGKNLSKSEEAKIKHYASSIVVKTAHSYQRILDEVGLFLHLLEDHSKAGKNNKQDNKLSALTDVLINKTVLIADDDVRNIFALTKALENYQVKIISATDGKEALKQLVENPHTDAVLMDMMMPEMDGYESIARMRQNPKNKNLPILAVTAKAMMGDREKCIEAGASDYISKPVDVDQLISLLRVWLYDKRV